MLLTRTDDLVSDDDGNSVPEISRQVQRGDEDDPDDILTGIESRLG